MSFAALSKVGERTDIRPPKKMPVVVKLARFASLMASVWWPWADPSPERPWSPQPRSPPGWCRRPARSCWRWSVRNRCGLGRRADVGIGVAPGRSLPLGSSRGR